MDSLTDETHSSITYLIATRNIQKSKILRKNTINEIVEVSIDQMLALDPIYIILDEGGEEGDCSSWTYKDSDVKFREFFAS